MRTNKLPTGIDVLDRKLDGGIPPGRAVALSASPASQSELFLYELASMRDTVYLTTERSKAVVQDVLDRSGTGSGDVAVYEIDDDDPIGHASRAISGIPNDCTLIVDPIELLERQPTGRYRSFLNDLKLRVVETDSIAFLHCLEGRSVPDGRDRTEYMADIIFDLDTTVRGDSVENRLTVPKFRGGQALEDAIKLNLTADVTIDVSRTIV